MMERLTNIVIFTPHSIEDILRTETMTISDDREGNSEYPVDLAKSYQTGDTQQETEYKNTNQETVSRRKKMRTTFSGRQIFELEKMFETKKYLNSSERSNLSR